MILRNIIFFSWAAIVHSCFGSYILFNLSIFLTWCSCCERNWSCYSLCFDTVWETQGGRQQSKHSTPVIPWKSLPFQHGHFPSWGAVTAPPAGDAIVWILLFNLFWCCLLNILCRAWSFSPVFFFFLICFNDSLLSVFNDSLWSPFPDFEHPLCVWKVSLSMMGWNWMGFKVFSILVWMKPQIKLLCVYSLKSSCLHWSWKYSWCLDRALKIFLNSNKFSVARSCLIAWSWRDFIPQMRLSLHRIFISWTLSPKNSSVNQKWSVKWLHLGSVMATHGHGISRRTRIFSWSFGGLAYIFKKILWWKNRGIGVDNIDSGLYFRKHSVAF